MSLNKKFGDYRYCNFFVVAPFEFYRDNDKLLNELDRDLRILMLRDSAMDGLEDNRKRLHLGIPEPWVVIDDDF